jgi:hypothetical protein
MIIEYRIGYRGLSDRVTCCGEFRDWDHFKSFCQREDFNGRIVDSARRIY